MSSWNALVSEVNTTIADMNKAASNANAAATQAKEAAQEAEEAIAAAQAATQAAEEAADECNETRAEWDGATFSVTKLDENAEPTFEALDRGGVKHLAIGVPSGKTGQDGAKGDPGVSGVTFTLTGTTLYIQKG